MFLSPLLSVLSCRFSSLSVGWFYLAVLVGGVARLRGCLCVRSASAWGCVSGGVFLYGC